MDGEEVYTAELTDDSRALNRVYNKLLRQKQQILETELELSPGRHLIRAEVFNAIKQRRYQDDLEIEVEAGQPRTLRVVAGRTFGRRLAMSLE